MHVSNSTQPTPPFIEDYQNHMDLTKSRNRIPKYVFWLELQIREKSSFMTIIHADTVQQTLCKNIFGKQRNTFLGQIRNPMNPERELFCIGLC